MVVVFVLVVTPCSEHAAGELDALLAEGLLLGQAVGVAAEVALNGVTSTLGAGRGRDGCSRSSDPRSRSPERRRSAR